MAGGAGAWRLTGFGAGAGIGLGGAGCGGCKDADGKGCRRGEKRQQKVRMCGNKLVEFEFEATLRDATSLSWMPGVRLPGG